MKTRATVVEIVDPHIAIVSVERRAACDGCHKSVDGKGCAICTLLGGKNRMQAPAKNAVGAAVGDIVELESRTARILGYAALVFLLPILLGLLGYFLAGRLGAGEGVALAAALGGFVFAFLPIWLFSRLVISRRLDIEIVSVVKTEE